MTTKPSTPINPDTEYAVEDADGMLLLIGREDDGRVYLSVQDREPVNLDPTQAVEVARQILARAGVTP